MNDPSPTLVDATGLSEGAIGSIGSIRWQTRDGSGATLKAYTYRPGNFDQVKGPMLFIMHGVKRNACDYLEVFRDVLDRNGALGIAPEFTKEFYPKHEHYMLGVGSNDNNRSTPKTKNYEKNHWRAPEEYTYSEVEYVFECVKIQLQSRIDGYCIYGHSAGAQFVHRLITFCPDCRAIIAVASNAGWYTLPIAHVHDRNLDMPYGLNGAPPNVVSDTRIFERRLVILLGGLDTKNDGNLRKSRQADAQGPNRFKRGQYYFHRSKEHANSLNCDFHWLLKTVPHVGHSHSGIARSAEPHLFP
eukprot:CAMPEP_0194216422 /NCGR_PEP_ID=MMETSP0156-20130528/18939_1 /TAXON_ID=33649 /ORGANISM="Thalassionema nitzschioides, Strain L26-B" /LENGTH=300 /DNA_ID=CAMNT_0038945187 /DNA_START=103 /DNA_END=1001 /DNA_ORIENTATION=+